MSVIMIGSMAFVGCSTSASDSNAERSGDLATSDYYGYLANSELITTNGGSAFGIAAVAPQLSGRLYPGAFVPGPTGQFVPNTDLLKTESTTQMTENGEQLSVLYTISEKATFSDGEPVTCVDFLLAAKAGQFSELFGSKIPLTNTIESLACAADNKRFLVKFLPGQGARWQYLFGPGTVLPAHKIAQRTGLTMSQFVEALYSGDAESLDEIAHVWRYGFGLGKFDSDLQVSYGPFVIEAVGEQGEVLLARNDSYYGEPAQLDKIVIWPSTADVSAVVAQGNLKLADSPVADPDWFDAESMSALYDVTTAVGDMTDSLLFSDYGSLSEPWARQAFSACIDQEQMAQISSSISGVEVPAVYVHSVPNTDPLARPLTNAGSAYRGIDLASASALWGTTVRIGYLGPNKRLAAMVEKMRATCAEAGIAIEDVSAANMSPALLNLDEETWTSSADVFLGPIDPRMEYGNASVRISAVEELRQTEQNLWEQMPALPLAAEPHTFFIARGVANAVIYTGPSGLGWNMDRWIIDDNEAFHTSANSAATKS
ncbi:MAG: ABC transporter substrate-binding protein [Corynebacterium sp.]|nr:ABC transporter substrate-binding protein [Corynebacterium sp.]